MIEMIFGYALALIIGLILGMLGGGGAILAVPVLVYLFKVSPIMATTYSLFIVGLAAGSGVLQNLKNLIDLKYIFLFGLPSIVAVIIVRRFVLPAIPDNLIIVSGFSLTKSVAIMIFFSVLMFTSGVMMLRKKKGKSSGKTAPWWMFMLAGYTEGSITGIVGAGGGFSIVPALVFLAKLDIKKAITASLLIVAVKSLIGFIADENLMNVDWLFLLKFTGLAIVGMVIGIYLRNKVATANLKRYFGIFLLIMSIFIIVKELL